MAAAPPAKKPNTDDAGLRPADLAFQQKKAAFPLLQFLKDGLYGPANIVASQLSIKDLLNLANSSKKIRHAMMPILQSRYKAMLTGPGNADTVPVPSNFFDLQRRLVITDQYKALLAYAGNADQISVPPDFDELNRRLKLAAAATVVFPIMRRCLWRRVIVKRHLAQDRRWEQQLRTLYKAENIEELVLAMEKDCISALEGDKMIEWQKKVAAYDANLFKEALSTFLNAALVPSHIQSKFRQRLQSLAYNGRPLNKDELVADEHVKLFNKIVDNFCRQQIAMFRSYYIQIPHDERQDFKKAKIKMNEAHALLYLSQPRWTRASKLCNTVVEDFNMFAIIPESCFNLCAEYAQAKRALKGATLAEYIKKAKDRNIAHPKAWASWLTYENNLAVARKFYRNT